MNQNYRIKPDMEKEIVKATLKKSNKEKKIASKQSVFEEIFWLGVADNTAKNK